MRRVWQCDYCSETESDAESIAEHEQECVFNPNNRNCYSCGNHETGPHTIMETCYAGVNSDTMQEIQDENKSCSKWIEENKE